MTLAEIIEKIGQLSPEDRAILRRELGETLPKGEVEEATPEMQAAIREERASSNDERGVPIEDVIGEPEPKDKA